MMKKVLCYLTFITTVCTFAQTKVGAVRFNDTDKFGETELMLNGAGEREKLYAIGLYLDFEVSGPEDGVMVSEKDEAMAITIKATTTLNHKELEQLIRGGLEVATNGNSFKHEEDIRKFIGLLPHEVKKFDIIRILHSKGGKLSIYKNRTILGTMTSKDFKASLFKIWLGENPVDYDLKENLLAAYKPNPVLGKWRMIDKESGVALSIVQVYIIDGKVFGTIEKMMRESERDDVCFKCSGEDKNKKIEGMTILKGLQFRGDTYEGGTYTNVWNGEVSDCEIWTEEDKRDVLYVKYKGGGGIHEWRRIKEPKK
ncbi:chalcone isomerase family protein [Aquimarina sp. D1M17]|uniref:chalcone isomerase family protein n=1 Tax=Aquimarina acroporae TaxID=2937283 RepID=UPI0020C0C322|nr:chalcone isomerase family protein [Aquimarina acroporae]MCK8522254.1 chalcone isomerase family protein [Aquimarina acroporae]